MAYRRCEADKEIESMPRMQKAIAKYSREIALLKANNIPLDWSAESKYAKTVNMEEYWDKIDEVLSGT